MIGWGSSPLGPCRVRTDDPRSTSSIIARLSCGSDWPRRSCQGAQWCQRLLLLMSAMDVSGTQRSSLSVSLDELTAW